MTGESLGEDTGEEMGELEAELTGDATGEVAVDVVVGAVEVEVDFVLSSFSPVALSLSLTGLAMGELSTEEAFVTDLREVPRNIG